MPRPSSSPSHPFRPVDATGPRWSERCLARAGIYRVEIHSRNGFFAQLSGLMSLLQMCERRGWRPEIILSSPLYVDRRRGRNILRYFFAPPAFTPVQRWLLRLLPTRRVHDFAELSAWSRDDHPALAESGALFHRHFTLRPEWAARVDNFACQHFQPGRTLGVHCRGTDKHIEASPISVEQVAALVRQCLVAHPALDRVFLATDSQSYVDGLKKHLPDVRLIVCEDELRARDEHAVHLRPDGDRHRKAAEALWNGLLLARCDVLLKTMSNLSGWAKVFNPGLRVYLMNRPAGPGVEWLGFPEREMVEHGWFAPGV